jgi:clan AA aspartic protease (TIGR02281 family)
MRNPAITMVGGESMTLISTGQPTYDEWLYKNGQLVMHSVALCRFDKPAPNVPQPSASAPTPLAPPAMAPPPVVSSAPAPITSAVDAVPITVQRGAIHVDVTLGGRPATMLLDTGANVSSISASLAADLLAAGQAKDAGSSMPVTLADGSTTQERVVIVKTLIIGAHTRWNVRMLVSPDSADMLLGLPILNAIGKFTVDAANSQLLLG